MQCVRLAQTPRPSGNNRARRGIWAILGALGVTLPALAVPTLIPLRDLPGGTFLSHYPSVSADGSVVVGYSDSSSGEQAFRWTQDGGMSGLGYLPGENPRSHGISISADGTAVVGFSTSSNSIEEAFRWTVASGMVGLGIPAGSYTSLATGVSADGGTVVGYSTTSGGDHKAFRWTASSGMISLGDLAGGSFRSEAYGVSTDGSVVVGYGTTVNGQQAFRWTQSGGMVGLGAGAAKDVSADGSVVVGSGYFGSGQEAFLWTESGGMIGLGDLPGGSFGSNAYGVSADGEVVVGSSLTTRPGSASNQWAFLWTPGGGMINLWDSLQAGGINPAADNWLSLNIATDVSPDGRYVAGIGNHNGNVEAFLVDFGAASVPEPNAYWAAGALLAWRAFIWRRRF